MLGSLISAGAQLVGGLLGRKATKEANAENVAMQREFAQNSIRWRAEDAKAAGIHPAYALGAPTMSFAPSSVGDTGMAAALSGMGQDIGRAVDVTRTGQERMDATVKALTLKRMGLENDLLAAQIANITQGGSRPNFPGGELLIAGQGDLPVVDVKPPQRTSYLVDQQGVVHRTGPATDAQVAEDRYGDLVQEVYGISNWINDHFPDMVKRLNAVPPDSSAWRDYVKGRR